MNDSIVPVRVSFTPDMLTLEWAHGSTAEFASIWLRDNLPTDRDPQSGQRLVDVADLPARPMLRSVTAREGAIEIEWQHEPLQARFSLGWLQARSARGDEPPERIARSWLEGAAHEAARDFAWAAHALHDASSAARLEWLTRLLQDGLAFMSAVPATDGALLDAMAGVGRVCETNYGAVFDVRSVPNPENLAYSDLGLGLHTDNPYREPVPGFQALQVLSASPQGGDSLFADGFALSNHLRAVDPDAFNTLTTTLVPFQYRAAGVLLHAERPLIQLSADGAVAAVHYNNRSIAPLRTHGRDAERFYAAYRRFAVLLRDPRHPLTVRMAAGQLVVFDNQRVLHGRTAFSSAAQPRHLRGCYLTRDSVYSQAALLRRALAHQEPP